MRIDALKFPLLDKKILESGKDIYFSEPFRKYIEQCENHEEEFLNTCPQNLIHYDKAYIFSSNIAIKAIEVFKINSFAKVISLIKDQCNVIIIGNYMYLYWFLRNPNKDDLIEFGVTVFEGDTVVGAYLCHFNSKNNLMINDNGEEGLKLIARISPRKDNFLMWKIMPLIIFKDFAEIETKILKSKTGTEISNCKYTNNTNKNIIVIDSTWITNLIQSEGFNVRGHFRLQPVGEGRKERKLIWVNDFQKNGYTREAGKLKHEAISNI